ncbi:phosphotransferase [Actinoplanes aureus]|uniref:Phosphotransferase n=1 Tax=Actinoplanes aureus TaxID=2792083 RepID=A0A931CBU9_9ACTN|nr:phosphotransferase [Actinoplanes aureus]MBG0564486.1 phosphotransferase [Actinoplanes aureus]
MSSQRPSPAVLRAFGAQGQPAPLAGGRGTSWAAGDLVFKPDDGPAPAWLASVVPDGFRLAAPVTTRDGDLVHDGWTATRWVAGSSPDYSQVDTWRAILAAGRAFHRAVADLPRPDDLDTRHDRWALADRVAWGERTTRFHPAFAGLAARLRAALRPLGPAQIVHGDLSGNVLFAPGLPPAVIDVSTYWRPPAYAEGVVIADALCWHDAPASLWRRLEVPATAVARALLFRMATTNELVDADFDDEARRYDRAATALGL